MSTFLQFLSSFMSIVVAAFRSLTKPSQFERFSRIFPLITMSSLNVFLLVLFRHANSFIFEFSYRKMVWSLLHSASFFYPVAVAEEPCALVLTVELQTFVPQHFHCDLYWKMCCFLKNFIFQTCSNWPVGHTEIFSPEQWPWRQARKWGKSTLDSFHCLQCRRNSHTRRSWAAGCLGTPRGAPSKSLA